MKNPIVIDPPEFDQDAAWKECSNYVDQCGGLQHEDGEPNWRAAAGADPGCCSCPNCGEHHWAWGARQRCSVCEFEYTTHWWPLYSEGCQDGLLVTGERRLPDAEMEDRLIEFSRQRFKKKKHDPYYRHGFDHPVRNAWWWRDRINWKYVLSTHGADMYTPSQRVQEQLENSFTYHRPQGNQPERYERIRDEAGRMAQLIATNTPESREQSLALTRLDEVVMFANAAIARSEQWDGSKMTAPIELEVEVETRRGRPVTD